MLLFDAVECDILMSKLKKYGPAFITVKRMQNMDQKFATLYSVKYLDFTLEITF